MGLGLFPYDGLCVKTVSSECTLMFFNIPGSEDFYGSIREPVKNYLADFFR